MRKQMIWILIGALALSMTGCSSTSTNKETTDAKTVDSNSVQETTEEDGREMVGNMYTTGLPIVKEKESFTLLVDDAGLAEDKVMFKVLEEQTNVEVELLIYPYETAIERKNILLNSGNYPDAIGGWLLNDTEILNDGMRDQLYVPINEYIDEYAPNMQEILEIPGVKQTMTLPDGNIYTIPYVIAEPEVLFIPWINVEWLERLGLDMPTTTEEFKDVLIAFRDNDANGNGDPNDEIPFYPGNTGKLALMAGWFGVNVSDTTPKHFAMVDGELEFQADKEGYKEYIKFMNSLYEEGLIDPEVFTQDDSMWKSKGKQDLYGVSMAYGPGDFIDLQPGEEGPFKPLPVLTSDYTDEPVYRRGSYGATTFRTQVAITDKAENPEVIVRWFDNVFELENSLQINVGPMDIRLEQLDDGQYREIAESTLSEADREKYGWGNLYTQSLPKYIPVGFELLPPVDGVQAYDHKLEADALYQPYLDEMVPKAWVSAEEASRLAIIETDIETYVNQKQAQWISGQANIDEEWDEYLEQLDRYGLQELIEIRRDAISNMQ